MKGIFTMSFPYKLKKNCLNYIALLTTPYRIVWEINDSMVGICRLITDRMVGICRLITDRMVGICTLITGRMVGICRLITD
jgi:hypothetical protein